jgi:hypothetical protein
MDISKDDAQESLNQIQTTIACTRKAIASGQAGNILMLWGLIWIAGFVGTYFFLARVWQIWFGLGGTGIVATFLICWRHYRYGRPTKSPASDKLGWRIFWFWTLLYAYLFIWISILRPYNGLQLNAFLCTAIMFAYVVMGLWFKQYFMVWLGLAVTAVTLVGFYLIDPAYYCLWMAPAGGGALLVTGLYISLRWR